MRGAEPPAARGQPVAGPGQQREQPQQHGRAGGQREDRRRGQHRVDGQAAPALGLTAWYLRSCQMATRAIDHQRQRQRQARARAWRTAQPVLRRLAASRTAAGPDGAERRPEQQPTSEAEPAEAQPGGVQRSRPGQPARQPPAGQAAGHHCRDREQHRLGPAQPGELPARTAPRAEQGGLALALAGQQAGREGERGHREQQQLQLADDQQRPGHHVAARDAVQHPGQAGAHLQAAELAAARNRLAGRGDPGGQHGKVPGRELPGAGLRQPRCPADGEMITAERGRGHDDRAVGDEHARRDRAAGPGRCHCQYRDAPFLGRKMPVMRSLT